MRLSICHKSWKLTRTLETNAYTSCVHPTVSLNEQRWTKRKLILGGSKFHQTITQETLHVSKLRARDRIFFDILSKIVESTLSWHFGN